MNSFDSTYGLHWPFSFLANLGFCMARGRGWLGSRLILDHMGEGRSEPLFWLTSYVNSPYQKQKLQRPQPNDYVKKMAQTVILN